MDHHGRPRCRWACDTVLTQPRTPTSAATHRRTSQETKSECRARCRNYRETYALIALTCPDTRHRSVECVSASSRSFSQVLVLSGAALVPSLIAQSGRRRLDAETGTPVTVASRLELASRALPQPGAYQRAMTAAERRTAVDGMGTRIRSERRASDLRPLLELRRREVCGVSGYQR
jgi:hypothetical protein